MKQTETQFLIEDDPFFAEDLRQMAKAKNYRRWQTDMISPYLNGHVLEVGAGIGNFTPELARSAKTVISLEPNRDCFRQLTEKIRSLPNVTALNITAECLNEHLPAEFLADTLVCMNVLEHVQNDEVAVRDFAQRLRVGGSLVLLVPAVPGVFGRIDQRLGHYRRYSKPGMKALLERTGFAVTKLLYFNMIGLFGWWWNSRLAKIEQQNDAQIRIFDSFIVPWLSRLESFMPPPIGQSLLAVGEKSKSAGKNSAT